MRVTSVLLRVAGLFVLLFALLLVGGSSDVLIADAQQRTCYRLVKTTSCLDGNTVNCYQERWNIFGQGDGSITGKYKENFGDPKEQCQWQASPQNGKFNLTCPSGSGEWTWQAPPQTWCSDQDVSLNASLHYKGTGRIEGRYTGGTAFQARMTGGPSGGIGNVTDMNPFEWQSVDVRNSEGSKSGTMSRLRPSPGLKGFTIASLASGWGLKPGGNATDSANFGVEYAYEAYPAGQEPPSSSTISSAASSSTATSSGSSASLSSSSAGVSSSASTSSTSPGLSTGSGSSTGLGSSIGPGSSTGTGATNTTLPMPPFGQAEPYANTPGMAIQAAQRRVGVGELVNVPVWLIKGNNVANINYELAYNASVARPEGTIRKGYLLDNAFFSANPNTSGIVRIGFAQANGISGTGPITYIPFRATGKIGARTPLSLAVTTINNPSGATLTIDRIPGEIVIVGPDGLIPGDCEGTGKALSALDVMCALEMSVQLIPVRLVMDMDNSRDVTSRDAAIIAQTILEIRR